MTDERTSSTRWSIFVGWHRTEQLWRDIYTRTAAALAAALVIYLVAAASGVVTRKPLPLLLLLWGVATIWLSVRESRKPAPAVPLLFGVISGSGLIGGAIWGWIVS